uniref:Conserved secreted protein n=1 Tax=Parastrongyloides trichosuri TaxID=131310 RepID=A0A0N4ZXM9_PARTI
MLLILLLIVPIISGWPNVRTGYDGQHCYQGKYTILLNGTFWCRGSPHRPSKLELWQYVGEGSGTKVDSNIQVVDNNKLYYNKTFSYKDTTQTLHVSLKVFHSCDFYGRPMCNHLYTLQIPDKFIYCNRTSGPFYHFTAELSKSEAQSNGGCPDDSGMIII